MQITEEAFEAFLKCKTKSYLKFNGVVGVPSEFSESQDHLREEYKQTCREQLCSAVRDGQWDAGTPDLQSLENGRYRLILDYVVTLPEIHARLDALEEIRTASNGLFENPSRLVLGRRCASPEAQCTASTISVTRM